MPEYKNYQKILTPIPANFDVPFLRNERLGYHYTGIEKLKSIVESGQLWFSSLADVNDSAEIADGIAVFTDFIRKRGGKGDWNSDWWKNLQKETIEDELSTCFVFCLTLDEDSRPMWELYAGNTDGCCVGFNYSNLIHSLLTKNFGLLRDGQFSYGFVVYNRNEKIRIFKTFIKACGNAVRSSCAKFFNKEIEEVPIKSPMWPESFHYYENSEDKIRRFAKGFPDFAFFKNRTFRYENELRIAVRIPKERQESLEARGKIRRDGNRRFLCLDFDLAQSVKRIYSAPKVTQIRREEILRITKSADDLRNVRIWASSSTIR